MNTPTLDLSADTSLHTPTSGWLQYLYGPLIPLAFAAVIYFVGIGELPLIEPDEGRNAEVAREMLDVGDWTTPHFNDLTYLDKPPVYFWLVAASFKLLGISAVAARLPSALLGMATVLLAWFWGRHLGGGGVKAALILASTPFMIIFSRMVIFEMTLNFLVSLSLLSFWFLERSEFRRVSLSLLFFAAMGLATITKGPVGFLLPLLTVIAYLGFSRRLGDLKRIHWAAGLATFVAVTLPWFLAVSWDNPNFPRYAFLDESLLRFATGSARRSGPIYYYVPVFLFGLLPWSLFLLAGYGGRWRYWQQLKDPENRASLFLFCWAAVVIVFFSISRSKLPGYLLPAFTPFSLLAAKLWDGWPGPEAGYSPPSWIRRGFWALSILGILIALTSWILGLTGQQEALINKLGPQLTASLGPTLLFLGVILVGISILGRHVAWRTYGAKLTLGLLVVTVPLLFLRAAQPLKQYAETHSSQALAAKILAGSEAQSPVYAYYCFRTGLGFYLRRPIQVITTDGSELTSNYIASRLQDFLRQPGTTVFDVGDVVRRAEFTHEPILILCRNESVSQMHLTFPSSEPFIQDWRYSVWRIPPARPSK